MTILTMHGSERFMCRWREVGGPPVGATQKGFGSAVLEQVMAEYLMCRPCSDFTMDGLCYQLNSSLEAMFQSGRVLPSGSR